MAKSTKKRAAVGGAKNDGPAGAAVNTAAPAGDPVVETKPDAAAAAANLVELNVPAGRQPVDGKVGDGLDPVPYGKKAAGKT